MTDNHTKEQRKYNMSMIKAKNTKPEILVRKYCHSLGLRYRLHVKNLPGKPDLFFPKFKVALFVNGCFWHRHNCKYGTVMPSSNILFWKNKFEETVKRDIKNKNELINLGIKVYKIWECQIKDKDKFKEIIHDIFRDKYLNNNVSLL